ncbi:hypothetical protein AMECASPLE_009811 [Ameca splendens]|uniref:PDZ domain-containing protein n=1 Tax=Ameca splendens TaxID=208324 RepID=A0ABV0XDE2_9TELE
MNGSLHSHQKFVDIKLKRGPTGDGAAALDGRLKEQDKILAINGVSLENLTHKQVVGLFLSAGENVELRVLKQSPCLTNGPADSKPERQSSMSSLRMLALFAGAVTIFVIAALYKRRK